MSLIDLPLKNSSAAVCATLERRTNPIKKDAQEKNFFIGPPSSIDECDAYSKKNLLRSSHVFRPIGASLNQAFKPVSSFARSALQTREASIGTSKPGSSTLRVQSSK
jgi:hypothetical protein